jgi:hypothetical protein
MKSKKKNFKNSNCNSHPKGATKKERKIMTTLGKMYRLVVGFTVI